MAVFPGWKVVAVCFAIASLSWGLGLFGSSVYLHALVQAHGWPTSGVAMAITLFFLVAAALQRPVAAGIARHGPRPVLATGALALCGGVALLGMAVQPWQLAPCFMLLGVGWAGLSTTALSATVAPWFERHQGRSITLAIMGASGGAIVGVPAMLAAIERFGLRGGLWLSAGVALALLLPLTLLGLRHRGPGEIGMRPDGDVPVADQQAAPPQAPPAHAARRLWSVGVAFALALMVQIGFTTHHLAIALVAMTPGEAARLIGATGIAAIAGRLVLARTADALPVRTLAAAMMLLQSAVLASLAFSTGAKTVVAASLVYGFTMGYITTLGPIVVRREFGAAQFAARYGAAASLIQFTGAGGPWAFGALRDAAGGYGPVMAAAAAWVLVAAVVVWAGAWPRLPAGDRASGAPPRTMP